MPCCLRHSLHMIRYATFIDSDRGRTKLLGCHPRKRHIPAYPRYHVCKASTPILRFEPHISALRVSDRCLLDPGRYRCIPRPLVHSMRTARPLCYVNPCCSDIASCRRLISKPTPSSYSNDHLLLTLSVPLPSTNHPCGK